MAEVFLDSQVLLPEHIRTCVPSGNVQGCLKHVLGHQVSLCVFLVCCVVHANCHLHLLINSHKVRQHVSTGQIVSNVPIMFKDIVGENNV